jgi:neutral ceramidase
MTSTHTHGGPVTYQVKGSPYSQEIEEYIELLKEKLVCLAVDATKNVVPFRMGMEKGICKMNMSRRAFFPGEYVYLGYNPDAPCDHEVLVVKFEDIDGNILAVLINWAAHGTAGGQENYQITGDWAGAAARYIKKQTGKDMIVGVTAGAAADVCPIYDRVTDFREIEAVGYHLAIESVNKLSEIITFPVQSLDVARTIMTFPGKAPGKDNFPPASFEPGPDVDIRLTVFKIGNLILAGASGELFNEIGMEIKKLSPYAYTMVINHCNGSTSGYICTDKSFLEGGYEVRTSALMPGVEKPLIEKYLEMINSL